MALRGADVVPPNEISKIVEVGEDLPAHLYVFSRVSQRF